MGGADGALWARIALCGWRGSASFGHPPRHRPRKGGVGGPEIVINRRAEPSRCMCVWLSVEGDDSDARGVLARLPRIAVSAVGCSVSRAPRPTDGSHDRHDVRSRFGRAGDGRAVPVDEQRSLSELTIIEYMFASYIDGKEAIYPATTAPGSRTRNRGPRARDRERKVDPSRAIVVSSDINTVHGNTTDGIYAGTVATERHDTERSTASNSFSHLWAVGTPRGSLI